MSKVSVQVANTCTWKQSMDEITCLEQVLNGGDFLFPPEAGDHQAEGLGISFGTLSSQFEIVV
jgi:hypothetical protein